MSAKDKKRIQQLGGASVPPRYRHYSDPLAALKASAAGVAARKAKREALAAAKANAQKENR